MTLLCYYYSDPRSLNVSSSEIDAEPVKPFLPLGLQGNIARWTVGKHEARYIDR